MRTLPSVVGGGSGELEYATQTKGVKGSSRAVELVPVRIFFISICLLFESPVYVNPVS